MSEDVRRQNSDRAFFLLLTPLLAASLPSLLFCVLEVLLGLHRLRSPDTVTYHVPPQNAWDSFLALDAWVYQWVAHWNSLATLLATAFFVFTLFRWRRWIPLALIPYGLLLCADFTLRWRYAFLR